MRLAVSLFISAIALTAGTSPAAAQLPALPLPDVVRTVEETTKKVVEDTRKVVEDTKKAVEDTERAVREVVDRTVGKAPDPGGGSGDGGPGGGEPDNGSGGGGPGGGDEPAGDGPGDEEAGGRDGAGGSGGGGGGGSAPGTKDGPGPPNAPGVEGGGNGTEGNATLAVSRSRASAAAEPSAAPSGAEALSGDSRDVQPGIRPAVATKAGPFVLAVLALAFACLVVGTGGGLRALYGRLRGV